MPTQQQQQQAEAPCSTAQKIGSAAWHVVHDLDLLAVNGSMFFAAGGQIVGGGLAIAGGCFTPTPFEPLSCTAGAAAGAVLIPGGVVTGAYGVHFFKNYTLPAIKDWGCSE